MALMKRKGNHIFSKCSCVPYEVKPYMREVRTQVERVEQGDLSATFKYKKKDWLNLGKVLLTKSVPTS